PPERKIVKQKWKKEQRIKKLGSIIVSDDLDRSQHSEKYQAVWEQIYSEFKKSEEVTGSDAHNDLFNNGDFQPSSNS
ncbi:9484_t:CDS:2, partial [Dentiscutata erythropus]